MTLKNNGYILISLSIALILMLSMIFACLWTPDKVYADYQDVLDDPTALVNFNQLSKIVNTTISGRTNYSIYYTYESTSQNLPTSMNSDHYYYIFINCGDSENVDYLKLYSSGVGIIEGTNVNSIVHNISGISEFRIYLNAIGDFSVQCNINIVDLSFMFGENNIPTLSQCHDLFIADYYNYTSSTIVPFGSFNNYLDAYDAIMSSFNYKLAASNVYASAYAVNGTITQELYNFTDSNNVQQTVIGTAYQGTGALAIPLGSIIESGNTVYIQGGYLGFANTESQVSSSSGYLVWACKINDNYVPLGFYTLFDLEYNYINDFEYNISFNLPYSVDTLYILESSTNYSITPLSNEQFGILNTTIMVPDLDYTILYTNSYNLGYDKAVSEYREGSSKYRQIFNAGKAAGIEQANNYSFFSLMSSVIEAPLNAVLSIFNFELLGYNLKSLFTFLLTLCVIVTIIRLIWGNA